MSRRSPVRPASARFAVRAGIAAALVGTLLVAAPTVAAIAARPAAGTTAVGTTTSTEGPVETTLSTPDTTPAAPATPTASTTPTTTAPPTPTRTATPTPTPSRPSAPALPGSGPVNSTSLTGRVTDQASGLPLVGVTVYIYTDTGRYGTAIPVTSTGADGTYTFYSLDVRNYTLQFTASGYRGEWLGGNDKETDAATFAVALGESVTGKDASLVPLDSISGTISAAGTTREPLAGATVAAFGADGTLYGTATTAADGDYAIAGLTPGRYSLRVTPPAGSSLVGDWWHDKTHPTTPASVQLDADAAVTGRNLTLAEAATITGRITDSTSGAAVDGAWVYAYASTKNGPTGGSIASASTDAAGAYALQTLPAGSYTLQFSGGSANGPAGYLREWWGNKSSRATAVSLAVAAGKTFTDADAALEPTGKISGTVYAAGARNVGLNAATVSAVTANGAVASTTATTGSGDYTLSGLKPGNYTLTFAAPPGTSFDSTWWHDESDSEKRGVIRVTAGQLVSGKNAELAVVGAG
jgi:protocatechuate 3,4-dioxygenase beta subunit